MRNSRVLTAVSVDGYLKRLGIDDPGEPSVTALRRLHRSHVERISYENLDIQLGRPTSADPLDSVGSVLRGRGGYCVQLNGAFSLLLSALGYSATLRRAGVQLKKSSPPASAAFNPHPAITVRLDGTTWLLDAGLGDGLLEPLPLRSGEYRQGPICFRLAPSAVEPGGWRLDHDPLGSITALEIAVPPARPEDFIAWHPYVRTSRDSRVVRLVTVMRRDIAGADRLTGCVLGRVTRAGVAKREITTRDDWFGALRDVFHLPLDDLDAEDRAALWAKVWAAHETWRVSRDGARARA